MDIDPKCDDLKNSRRFMQHAAFLISMIDKTVNMLGVDNAELTETLTGLGKMHVTYGVQASYFPMMTESIVFMLKNQLGNEFQHSDNSAWRHVLGKADDDLTVLLTDLGVKHIRYGVKTDYFVHMKRAIIAMLQEKLGMKLTEDDVTAWDEVLSALISDMTKAQREQQMIEAQKAYKK
jgi:hemoglobin-like flavoprotein